jgi:hypothetical protein
LALKASGEGARQVGGSLPHSGKPLRRCDLSTAAEIAASSIIN